MELVVARIGRPHGVRGEVTVEVRTDVPERRLVPGARLTTDPPAAGPLTVHAVRAHNGRVLVTFEEVPDRTTAEHLRDVLLLADVAEDAEPDAWHVHELVGLRAESVDGRLLGQVTGVEQGTAQDLLVVRQPSGHEALVPFVAAIVPTVDVDGGRVVLDPPGGLLDDGTPMEDDRLPEDGA